MPAESDKLHEKISHMFEKLEKKFLIYAKVLVKIPPLIEFLQDEDEGRNVHLECESLISP